MKHGNQKTQNIRPPIPPFTAETAKLKVQAAEDAWNTRNPELVATAYTENSQWRNRSDFISGRAEIEKFLARKWYLELDYKLKKHLWTFSETKIAVKFEYEWRNHNNNWFRSYGNELWEFAENGLMMRRYASINDMKIKPEERTISLCSSS